MRMYRVVWYVDGVMEWTYCDSRAAVDRLLKVLEVGTRYSVYKLDDGEYQLYRSGTTR